MRKTCRFRSFCSCERKVSFQHLFSINTFYSVNWFCMRTAKALIRLRGCAGWSGPSLCEHAQWRRPVFMYTCSLFSFPFTYTSYSFFIFIDTQLVHAHKLIYTRRWGIVANRISIYRCEATKPQGSLDEQKWIRSDYSGLATFLNICQ